MSGLEALGIACNVVQLLSFAHETISFCKAILAGQAPNDYNEETVASLATLSALLQTRCQNVKPQTSQERELERIATKCNVAARALEDEFRYLSFHQAEGNLKQTLLVAMKVLWRQNRLKGYEAKVRRYQQTMESHLLAKICTQSDAIEIRQREDFEKLSGDLQYFISQYSAGHTGIADLMSMELASANDHTTKESLRSEASIKSHVSSEVTSTERAIAARLTSEMNEITGKIAQVAIESDRRASAKEQHDRLLGSLRYPAMNRRKNDLNDSHQNTFQWIFADDARESDILLNSMSISDTSISVSSSGDDYFKDYKSDYRSNIEDVSWDSFSDWLRSDSKIYWVSGKPGSGKSTLIKYILDNPLTKAGLEIWGTNPVILWHFFWKPGSKMENSLKGFLCSMLHQCLSYSTHVLNSVLATWEPLLLKQSVTDWSMRELRDVCMAVLKSYPSPICIFVDGLDEICNEDGPLPILKLVSDIQAISKVKICVASRPEPSFHSALSRHQHLRLQDLTENDMREYSKARIQPYVNSHKISREFDFFIVETLVYKAEGVFLWLHLATRSLISGVENGDLQDEIGQRLHDLPNELSTLYADIEGKDLYYVLPPSLFHIVAAPEPQVQYALVDERATMDPEFLEKMCTKVQHAIHLRCAGLLEVSPCRTYFPEHWQKEVAVRDPHFQTVLPHGTVAVQFIHRTAYDFVTNTEDGHQIRSHDIATRGTLCIQLIKAELAYSKIFKDTRLNNALPWIPQAEIYKLIRIARDWYGNGYFFISNVSQNTAPKTRHPFLAAAILFPRLHDFVLSSISESPDPELLAADILRDIDYHECLKRTTYFSSIINVITDLLHRNDSLRLKGTCYTTIRSQPLPRFTPFGCLLQKVLEAPDSAFSKHEDYLVGLLYTFIRAGPDLNERIPLFIYLPRLGPPRLACIDQDEDSTKRFDLSEYRDNRGMLELVLIVSNAALLTKAILKKCHRIQNNLRHFPDPPAQARFDSLDDPNRCQPSIRLVTFCADNHPDPDRVRRYQPTTEAGATEPLAALLMQFISGDLSTVLSRKIRRATTDIRRDICNGSTDYEEVYKTARTILAKEKCGYRFTDENGDPIEMESDSDDDDLDQRSDGDGPYDDRFYDDSDDDDDNHNW
ncbi:hypothetical protein GGR53DRAFT_521656 [Hypoxylon sp. FL1150]|nr:hypothetical protein GGR53DRAFT_521656 [Hypoxylon sp. FL1150]